MKSFFIAFLFFLKNLCINSLKSFLIWPNFFLSVFIFGFGSLSVLSSSSDRFIMFILKHKRFFYVIKKKKFNNNSNNNNNNNNNNKNKKKKIIMIVIIIIIVNNNNNNNNNNKNLQKKLPWEKLDVWAFFEATTLCDLHSTLASQTRKVLHQLWTLPQHKTFFFFECLGIRFLNSLTCDLRDTMPPQRSLTLLPREAEDSPRDDRHFKHVSPRTYLIYLSPKELYMVGLFKRYGY